MSRPSKTSLTAEEPSNSISPLEVMSVTEPPCPGATCTSMSPDSSLTSRSRSSRSAAAGGAPEVTTLALRLAMPARSSFARDTAAPTRFSASIRKPWMPFAIARKRPRRVEHAGARREGRGVGGEGLQRAGERVHGAVERARAAWLTEEPVDIGREARIQRRVGGARGLEPELALGDEVDDALDVAGAHAGGALARELLDRREAAAGVARRVGVH